VTTKATRPPYTAPATDERIERVADALGRHNIEAIVVETGAEARERVLALLLEGADVHWRPVLIPA
jgi:hypothetical protein